MIRPAEPRVAPALSSLNLEDYEAIMVAGGPSPMCTYRESEPLKHVICSFYESERPTSDRVRRPEVTPWRLEDLLRERGANDAQSGLFKAFAVRERRLITGRQQWSGRKVAQMVIEALGA